LSEPFRSQIAATTNLRPVEAPRWFRPHKRENADGLEKATGRESGDQKELV
jgi:hypothetical protein